MEILFVKKVLCKVLKNKDMVGKLFQEFSCSWYMEREAVVWNFSRLNTLKGKVLHRTVPRHGVNGNPIPTCAEQFHIEPFQSSRVSAALM